MYKHNIFLNWRKLSYRKVKDLKGLFGILRLNNFAAGQELVGVSSYIIVEYRICLFISFLCITECFPQLFDSVELYLKFQIQHFY